VNSIPADGCRPDDRRVRPSASIGRRSPTRLTWWRSAATSRPRRQWRSWWRS